ncbi:hypothetical protein BCR44DRAFT_1191181 [Catenaria anguillulae PL171]|uniref:B9 domain-containing protein 1 n=1 Tax=Catenaria anguillulae PL171 TaxID=765915 RepID=A0A1Y2HIW1_9FUNG|nr:hypothetical protein BCR44DRAFT_1191181 [Catenaria anguillulae PL171]
MNTFTLHLSGELDSCHSTRTQAMYATLNMLAGPDWTPNGQVQLVTQLAYRPTLGPPPFPTSPGSSSSHSCHCCFPHPRGFLIHQHVRRHLVMSLFHLVAIDQPIGLAATARQRVWPGRPEPRRACWIRHVACPRHPGRHVVYAPLFVPRASSKLNEWLSWAAGRPPEVVDLGGVFGGEGKNRHVLRVRSDGMVKLVLNVAVKDLDKFGYQFGPSSSGVAGGGMGVGMPGASSGG